MQYGVSIVNGTIHGIPIDVLEVWLILGFFIVYLPLAIKLDKLVLISFVFDEDRIVVETFVLKEQLGVRTIGSGSSVFAEVLRKRFVNLSVKTLLLQLIVELIGLKPTIDEVRYNWVLQIVLYSSYFSSD